MLVELLQQETGDGQNASCNLCRFYMYSAEMTAVTKAPRIDFDKLILALIVAIVEPLSRMQQSRLSTSVEGTERCCPFDSQLQH